MRTFLLAIVVAAAAATGTAASELSGSELKATLVGKNLQWRTSDGKLYGKTVYSPNGKAALSGSNVPTGASDEGTWRITGNKLCATWRKLRQGKESCFTATKRKDGAVLLSNGVVVTVR